ncbi:MAG TPA: hypothetical protein PK431_05245 [Chitinophagales bacterium]|nr:hypothetical protein [Chitinophagales bacterium]
MPNTTITTQKEKEINLYPNENPKNAAEAKKDEKLFKITRKKLAEIKDDSIAHLIGFVNHVVVQKLLTMI